MALNGNLGVSNKYLLFDTEGLAKSSVNNKMKYSCVDTSDDDVICI